MRMIFVPIVLMMRLPPAIVPSGDRAGAGDDDPDRDLVACAGSIQCGHAPAWPAATNARSASVMMPIDFCASFEPCAKAIMQAESSCRRREPLVDHLGRAIAARPRRARSSG